MFIPRIVGADVKTLTTANSPLTEAELAEVMELLGAVGIDSPLPARVLPPRPRPASLYQCPACQENEPPLVTTTCDLCYTEDTPCHHNPRDGYVCRSCAAAHGLCYSCGCKKPSRARYHR